MTTLPPWQIAALAANVGFSGERLVRAVAVALAESGGNPKAVGVNSDSWRSRDRGLWQINDHWHPEVSDAQAFNPQGCAQAAYTISSGGRDWSPWSTWKNGSAQAQMGRARMGVRQLKGGKIPNTASDTTGKSSKGKGGGVRNAGLGLSPDGLWNLPGAGLGLLDDAAGLAAQAASPLAVLQQLVLLQIKAGAWIANPHNWFRVALVVGGTGGVVLGLVMLAKSGAAGETAQGTVKAAGKAAKLGTDAGLAALSGGASVAAKTATTAAKGSATAAKTTAKAAASAAK